MLRSGNNNALVTGSGSVWSSDCKLYVGGYCDGNSLVISNGGKVVNADASVGIWNNNSVLVTGSGSVWSNQYELDVGQGGTGNSLVISNGGKVVAANLVLGCFVSSSNNLLRVNGGNLIVSNWSGSGVLDIRQGTFAINSGTATLDQFLRRMASVVSSPSTAAR